MTKPGNSDPAEPTADEAPEPTVASTEAADGTPELPTTSAEDPASPPPSSHESPTRAPGGPPNSTLPESTDNSGSSDSGSSDATAEDGTEATAEPAAKAEAAGAEPAEAADAKPSAKAESAEPAPAAAKRVPKARAKAAAADEEPEPLMAELERAPLPPNAEVLRAQAKRRFEEPPPRMLRFSFYFFTAAGLVWLGSMVLSLFYKQQIIDAQVKANKDPKITPEQLAGAVNQILWIVTIAALAFTIFLALFGYKATEGARRGRTLVTIFAAILVIFHVFLNGTQLGILSALFGLVGLGLLWAPSSRAYFPPRELR